MSAKLLSLKLGAAAVAAATAVWASYGPDSMLQNQVFDDLRARQAHGRLVQLSDNQPVGDRYAVLMVLGRNGAKDVDGPSEEALHTATNLLLADWKSFYPEITGRKLEEDVAVFGYWYNSDFADPKIAADMLNTLEVHSYFTQASAVYSAACYSKGVNVGFLHWAGEGDRKLETIVASAGPQLGAPMADEQTVIDAGAKTLKLKPWVVQKACGVVGIDWSSAGIQWLAPMYPPLMDLRKQNPLTDDWYLLAGVTQPSGKSTFATYFDVANWLDSISLSEGMGQDIPAYRLGAKVLQNAGVQCGSDGMVSVDSALCEGYAGEAHKFVLQDHNHSQMLQGNGGIELHKLMLQCLLPRILAHRDKRLKSFDLWLPELPRPLLFADSQPDNLKPAKLAWIDKDSGDVMVGDGVNTPQRLVLPAGHYSWPQWLGDEQLVAGWDHGRGQEDIAVLRSDNAMMAQLTMDGESSLPAVQDEGLMIVFVSRGDLVVRSVGGMAKTVVKGPVYLETPPAFLGDKIYFAHHAINGHYELRYAELGDIAVPLAQTQLVAADLDHPIRIGNVLLAFQSVGDQTYPVVVTKWWAGILDSSVRLGLEALQGIQSLPQVSEVAVGSEGDFYLVTGAGELRQVNLAILVNVSSTQLQVLVQDLQGQQLPSTPVELTLEQLMPLRYERVVQLTVK